MLQLNLQFTGNILIRYLPTPYPLLKEGRFRVKDSDGNFSIEFLQWHIAIPFKMKRYGVRYVIVEFLPGIDYNFRISFLLKLLEIQRNLKVQRKLRNQIWFLPSSLIIEAVFSFNLKKFVSVIGRESSILVKSFIEHIWLVVQYLVKKQIL